MRLWPRALDDRGRAYAFDVSTVQSWRDRAKRSSGVVLVLGFIAIVVGLSVVVALHGRVPDWLRYALMLAAMAPFCYASKVLMQKEDIRDSDRLGRVRGLCPACGYPMTELEPEDDGCRVCPECGSAWRMDADTSPPAS